MSKGRLWSKEEIDFIKKNYDAMSRGELAKQLDRSYSAVDSKITELKLYKKSNEWSCDEINYLKQHYSDMPYSEIGKNIGRSRNAVQCKLRVLGLSKPEKYSYNTNYFEKIDTEDKAYWLGFIFADGWISGSELGIELCRKDIKHLKKFNKCLNGNINIICKINEHTNNDFIKSNYTESCIIRLYRNKIVEDLKQHGVQNRKTYKDNYIPSLSNDLIKHFIRGFFDGDGNVWIDRKKNKQLRYTLYNASLTLLTDIRNELYKNNIFSQIISDNRPLYKKTTSCYRLIIGGIANAYNFYNYLYKESNIYLDRKYNYAIKAIDTYDIKNRASKKSTHVCLSN